MARRQPSFGSGKKNQTLESRAGELLGKDNHDEFDELNARMSRYSHYLDHRFQGKEGLLTDRIDGENDFDNHPDKGPLVHKTWSSKGENPWKRETPKNQFKFSMSTLLQETYSTPITDIEGNPYQDFDEAKGLVYSPVVPIAYATVSRARDHFRNEVEKENYQSNIDGVTPLRNESGLINQDAQELYQAMEAHRQFQRAAIARSNLLLKVKELDDTARDAKSNSLRRTGLKGSLSKRSSGESTQELTGTADIEALETLYKHYEMETQRAHHVLSVSKEFQAWQVEPAIGAAQRPGSYLFRGKFQESLNEVTGDAAKSRITSMKEIRKAYAEQVDKQFIGRESLVYGDSAFPLGQEVKGHMSPLSQDVIDRFLESPQGAKRAYSELLGEAAHVFNLTSQIYRMQEKIKSSVEREEAAYFQQVENLKARGQYTAENRDNLAKAHETMVRASTEPLMIGHQNLRDELDGVLRESPKAVKRSLKEDAVGIGQEKSGQGKTPK